MPAIYADSFGGLTAARQRDDALRQQAFAVAMGNFQQAVQSSRNSKQNDREMQYRKEQDTKLSTERAADRTARDKEIRMRNLLDLSRNMTSRGQLDLERQKFNFAKSQPTPASAREYQLQLESADMDAAEGALESREDFVSKYPKLAPLADAFVDKSIRVRPMIEAQYHVSSGLASALNEHQKLGQQIQEAEALGATRNLILPDSDAVNAAQEAAKPNSPLRRKYQVLGATIPDKKQWQDLVYYDPKEGFRAAVPAPRWMQLPETGARTNGPSGTSPAQKSGAPGQKVGQFESGFYDRVNALIASGMSPVAAKRQALSERVGP